MAVVSGHEKDTQPLCQHYKAVTYLHVMDSRCVVLAKSGSSDNTVGALCNLLGVTVTALEKYQKNFFEGLGQANNYAGRLVDEAVIRHQKPWTSSIF